jgi:hypothetical protein
LIFPPLICFRESFSNPEAKVNTGVLLPSFFQKFATTEYPNLRGSNVSATFLFSAIAKNGAAGE